MADTSDRKGNGVKMSVDKADLLVQALEDITSLQVMVGVPADQGYAQTKAADEPINNATKAYVHDNGTPTVPRREFMRPGVNGVSDEIVKALGEGGLAILALEGNGRLLAEQALNKAGLIAQNGIKRKILSGDFLPLAESTVRARMRRTGTGQVDADMLGHRAAGQAVPSVAHADATGIRPLVDKAEMLNSITFVLQDRRQ